MRNSSIGDNQEDPQLKYITFNLSSMDTLTRPWQGTALAVVDIIGTVFTFLAGIAFLFLQGMISSLLGAAPVEVSGSAEATAAVGGLMGMLAGFSAVIGIVLIAIGILLIFMTRGAFKGQKWSPIISIVFVILGIVSLVTNFTGVNGSFIFSLVVDLFVLYCAVMCVKSPYFGPKV